MSGEIPKPLGPQGLTPAPLTPADGRALTGFADCEGLIAAMLEDLADIEREKEHQNRALAVDVTDDGIRRTLLALAAKHHNRLSAIQEIQLAVSMGQHRDARYGDSEAVTRAHHAAANRGRGRVGGVRSAEKLTPEERIERARKAARARWAKSKRGSE